MPDPADEWTQSKRFSLREEVREWTWVNWFAWAALIAGLLRILS